jgi:macrolide transport system ATP-binding/permease protein
MSLAMSLERLWLDVRIALRNIGRRRSLFGATIATLGCGIGVSSGIFSLVNAIALRPPVDVDRASYAALYLFTTDQESGGRQLSAATLEQYKLLRDRATLLREIAAWAQFDLDIAATQVVTTRTLLVSEKFWSLFGSRQPILGRVLQPTDFSSDTPVIVIDEDLWRDYFLENPTIVGTSIHVNGRPVTIIGVVPRFGGEVELAKAWLPYTLAGYLGLGEHWTNRVSDHWLQMGARLAPSATRLGAASEASTLLSREDELTSRHPKTSAIITDGAWIHEPGTRSIVLTVMVISSVLTLVVLITCANVSTLLLCRANAMQGEMAIRLSLGARRVHLLQMLLVEGFLIIVIAASVSLLFVYSIPRLLAVWLAGTNPGFSLSPDWRVFTYFGVSATCATLFAGLLPALQSLKGNIGNSLKGDHNGGGASNLPGAGAVLFTLVTVQVAIGCAICIGATLFVRAHPKLLKVDLGYDSSRIIIVRMMPYATSLQNGKDTREDVRQQINGMPDVENVASASSLPFRTRGQFGDPETVSFPDHSAAKVAGIRVSPDYFSTLGIPIVAGRTLLRTDISCGNNATPCPVVVSEDLARQYLSVTNALGAILRTTTGKPLEVVGIAKNVSSELYARVTEPIVYEVLEPQSNLSFPFFVRARLGSNHVANAVAGLMRHSFPNARSETASITAVIAQGARGFWKMEMIVALLAITAIVLAMIGIYGVVLFAVTRRKREMAVRIALGAAGRDIVIHVIQIGLRPIWVGLGCGVLVAMLGAQALKRVFPQFLPIEYYSPVSYIVPILTLCFMSVLTMLPPAMRAIQCDPNKILREQ